MLGATAVPIQKRYVVTDSVVSTPQRSLAGAPLTTGLCSTVSRTNAAGDSACDARPALWRVFPGDSSVGRFPFLSSITSSTTSPRTNAHVRSYSL